MLQFIFQHMNNSDDEVTVHFKFESISSVHNKALKLIFYSVSNSYCGIKMLLCSRAGLFKLILSYSPLPSVAIICFLLLNLLNLLLRGSRKP
jgi:hypothetical protein